MILHPLQNIWLHWVLEAERWLKISYNSYELVILVTPNQKTIGLLAVLASNIWVMVLVLLIYFF